MFIAGTVGHVSLRRPVEPNRPGHGCNDIMQEERIMFSDEHMKLAHSHARGDWLVAVSGDSEK